MTRIAGLALASLALLASFGVALGGRTSAQAAVPFTVSVSPAKETVPVGELAVFNVKVEGQTASLPSFSFEVEGGAVAGVGSIDPTAANVAEGTVFVSRESEGTAKLTVRFGSEVLAAGQAKFARMGKVDVRVTLDAGPDAAARTWRYEVLTPGGQVVATLQANTSGDSPADLVSTADLPYGFYTVRQVLGNDTRTACAAGVFYRVTTPGSAETTIELAAGSASANFSIAPCPDLPTDLGVVIPIDTIAPGGVVGDADVLPGETPISEVRGTRQEGPDAPLPPATGNSVSPAAHTPAYFFLLLVLGLAATATPVAAFSVAAVRHRYDR
jgi:hypothetical protein